MRLAEAIRAKEAAGETPPAEWSTPPSKNSGEEGDCVGALAHISRAVSQCTAALKVDVSQCTSTYATQRLEASPPPAASLNAERNHPNVVSQRPRVIASRVRRDGRAMKALYRRGQAFRMMGDLIKAKDDLLAAARRAPDSRELRNELDEVRRLGEEEDARAKVCYLPTSPHISPHLPTSLQLEEEEGARAKVSTLLTRSSDAPCLLCQLLTLTPMLLVGGAFLPFILPVDVACLPFILPVGRGAFLPVRLRPPCVALAPTC